MFPGEKGDSWTAIPRPPKHQLSQAVQTPPAVTGCSPDAAFHAWHAIYNPESLNLQGCWLSGYRPSTAAQEPVRTACQPGEGWKTSYKLEDLLTREGSL